MEKTIKSSYRKRAAESEFTVNARILAKQDNLVKALASAADITEKRERIEDGRLSVAGRINVKLICLDDERASVALNYNVDFDESTDIEALAVASEVRTEISVEEMNVRLLGNKEAEIVIRCKVTCDEYVECVLETVIPEEGLITKTELINVGRIAAEREETFTVTHEMPLQNGEVLLQTDARAVLTGSSVADGVLTLSGKLYFQPVYLSDEGLPKVTMLPISFSEEIGSENIGEGTLLVRLNVESTRVRIIEEEGSSFLNAEFTLKAAITCVVERTVECLKDCYSIKYELKRTENDVTGMIYKGMTSAQIGFSGNITCEASVARALGVFDVRAVISQARAGENSVQISGMITGSFLYLDADDNISSQGFALPFAALVNVPDCNQISLVTVDAAVTDAAVKRNGGGADVAGTVTASVYVTENKTDRIIGEVQLGDEKQPVAAAIEAVIANPGDDVWSIGKALNMTAEEILELNPELSSPLTSQTKVVVYHRL